MSPRALLRLSARRAVLGLALALVAAGTSSCDLTDDSGSFDHFTLEDATPQDVATIEGTSLRLAVGAVVAVTVKCFDAENKPIGEVTLGKNDDEPMGAAATKSANVFVFYGRRSGTGRVRRASRRSSSSSAIALASMIMPSRIISLMATSPNGVRPFALTCPPGVAAYVT